MNDQVRNYYNTFVRVRDFGAENAADFPAGSAGAVNFAAIAAAVDEIEASGATQASGATRESTVNKSVALAELLADIRAVNRTARAIAVDNPAVGELFRMPRGSSEQNLLAAARAFVTDAAPLESQFTNYGLPTDFLADLQADIASVEQSVTGKSAAIDNRVGATASIGATVEAALNALRRLRAIVANKYRDDPKKLAAWTSASHVERAPKKKPTPPVNP